MHGGGLGVPPGLGGLDYPCQVSVGLAVAAGRDGRPAALCGAAESGGSSCLQLESLVGPGRAALAGAGQDSGGSRAWPQQLLVKGKASSLPPLRREEGAEAESR